jgi:Leishmanolysin
MKLARMRWFAATIAANILDTTASVVILPQLLVPPATRHVGYGPLRQPPPQQPPQQQEQPQRRRTNSRAHHHPAATTLPGWHHVHADASLEDPDQVFAMIRSKGGITTATTSPFSTTSGTTTATSSSTLSSQHASETTLGWSIAMFVSFLTRQGRQRRRSLQEPSSGRPSSGQQQQHKIANEEAFVGQEMEWNITAASSYEDFEDDNSTVTWDGTVVSSDTEYNITEHRYNNQNDTTTVVSTNNTIANNAMEYRPLRIKAFVSDEAGNAQFLNQTEHTLLLSQILRPALLAWSAALRVLPVHSPLTVDPQQLVQGQYCGPGPSVQVPPSHIQDGVANVDMILYVHMSFQNRPNATEHCAGDYVAASSFCSTDQFDRPVAALLHLCITEGFFNDIQSNIQSVMHEIGHGTFFSHMCALPGDGHKSTNTCVVVSLT